MARLVVDDSTDELPDIDILIQRAREKGKDDAVKNVKKKKRVLGRRRDGDNPLLRPLARGAVGKDGEEGEDNGLGDGLGRPKGREKRTVPPVLVEKSRDKTETTARSKRFEESTGFDIQETTGRASYLSESDVPVPARLKSRAVKSKKILGFEIQEKQRDVTPPSDSEPYVPTTSRSRNKIVKVNGKEKTPELEVQETQQDDLLRTVQPKLRILEKRNITPLSDFEEPIPVTASRLKSRTTRNRRRESSELGEEESSFSSKPSKTASKRIPSTEPESGIIFESEEEVIFFDALDEETDGMSDFVVDDSEVEEMPPPRSVRRLVKGRRPEKVKSHEKRDLEELMRGLNMDGNETDPFEEQPRETKTKGNDTERQKKARKQVETELAYPKLRPLSQTSTDLDNPFTIRLSPPGTKSRKVSKELRFTTPPGSPLSRPKGLQSPKKIPRIPSTPHGVTVDDFWSQDVVNDWNDEYSPRKTPKPPPKSLFSKSNTVAEDALFSPKKSPTKQDRITKDAKKAFAERKHLLAETFLIELDNVITNGQVAKLAQSTGGVKIIWSKKLNTTAGRANWKRETIRSSTLVGPDGRPVTTYRHHAAIELAEKVIDDEDRLLNVIAHEFCHLANFMISNIKTNPHGKEFKAWASQVSRHFKDRGIEVTTKHSYTIDYKYIWECENCGLEFKRHSKSIDPTRHRCGSCKATLVQMKPAPRKAMVVSEYQVFLKENMKTVMKENPNSPQKEILGLVGKRYQEFKAGRAAGQKSEGVDITEIDVTSKETTPEDDRLDVVSRKLDFLDLTSP